MKLAILVLALAASALAEVKLQTRREMGGRIIGGKDAVAGQFPYQISLQWNFLGILDDHICGGSILSPTWVLTAGHCVTDAPPGDYRIVAGITDLRDQGQAIAVVRRVVHPDFKGGVGPNDIALLQLATPLTFNDAVQPVALPVAEAVPSGDVVLSGWGSTSTTSSPIMPLILQTVDLPILSLAECRQAFNDLLGIDDSGNPLNDEANVCTGVARGTAGACSGDSGGPLAQNGTVVGIVSWGLSPCGVAGAPSVYTRVSNYEDFIRQHVTDLA